MRTKFEISKPVFESEKYATLRAFYEQIVGLESEQLVLERPEWAN